MSKLLCTVAFYQNSTLLESPIAELSLNPELLSISIPYRIRGKPPGPKRRNPGINVEVTMYGCLLPQIPLAGALRKSLLESPVVELSLDSNLLSISIPRDQGKYLVHQAEPLYLARLNTTQEVAWYPRGCH